MADLYAISFPQLSLLVPLLFTVFVYPAPSTTCHQNFQNLSNTMYSSHWHYALPPPTPPTLPLFLSCLLMPAAVELFLAPMFPSCPEVSGRAKLCQNSRSCRDLVRREGPLVYCGLAGWMEDGGWGDTRVLRGQNTLRWLLGLERVKARRSGVYLKGRKLGGQKQGIYIELWNPRTLILPPLLLSSIGFLFLCHL